MRLGWIVAALTLLAASLPARGADREQRALTLLDHGVEAYHRGDYVAARQSFEAARRLAPERPNAYRWLGMAEAALGECTRAVVDFDTFLQKVPAIDERVPEVVRLRGDCLARPPPPGSKPLLPVEAKPATRTAPDLVPTSVTSPVAPAGPRPRRWPWIVTGVGAAVLAAAVTTALLLTVVHDPMLPVVRCVPGGGCSSGP